MRDLAAATMGWTLASQFETVHMIFHSAALSSRSVIAQAYAAFNRRDIDGVLALMSDNVSWPKASEGGRAIGKAEVRAYWTRQWVEFDPQVIPLEMMEHEGGKTHVRVHQLVKGIEGKLISDTEVWHLYTLTGGLIERMDLDPNEAGSGISPVDAFSSR